MNGNELWAEKQTVTVDRGYFSVMLGQGSSVDAKFTNNVTSISTGPNASDRYIGMTVNNPPGGPQPEIRPRLRLLASPYSFLAANANAIINASGAPLVTMSGTTVGINKPSPNPSSALDVGGTVTATAFAGGGAGLTGLTANNIIGTLSSSQLPADLARLDAITQTFTGYNAFNADTYFASHVTLSGRGVFNGQVGIGTDTPDAPVEVFTTTDLYTPLMHVRGASSGPWQYSVANIENTYNGSSECPPALRVVTWGNSSDGALCVSANGSAGLIARFGNYANFVADIRYNGTFDGLAFNASSDRQAKENFAAVQPRAVLEKVAALPMNEWDFKQDPATRHLGPMAQDFYAAFGLGTDDKHIATVDAEGVALAAIQGLNQKVEQQAAELKAREAELQALKQSVAELKEALARLATAAK